MKNYLPLFVIVGMTLFSCTKDAANNSSISESGLSSMALSDAVIMKNTITSGSETWNIKMNDIASKAFAKGNNKYPLNSMLVKEKHDASGKITGIDIMYKTSGDVSSVDGWMYEEINPNGQIVHGPSTKNLACQSCHVKESRNMLH